MSERGVDTLVDGVSYFLDAHLEGRAPAGRIVKTSGVASLDLRGDILGPYLRKAIPDDPWGKPYIYKQPGLIVGDEIRNTAGAGCNDWYS